MNNNIENLEILRSAKEVFGGDYRGLINQISSDLIDAQKALKYSKKKYRLFNPDGAEFAIDHLFINGCGFTEDENILINLVAEKIQQIMINRAELEAQRTAESTESTEETAESTEETEYYIAGVKIDKYTADDLYWEEIAYCCGYDPALADVVDKNTSEDLWWEEVAYICGYDPSLANDNEEVIEEDIKMDNNINDVSSNVFFFTERGQMELNRIRVKGVHANDFLVGSITDDAKKLMLEMKPMNHEFNKSDFITMGYLIEEALKSYSRFYEYCQYIYGLGAVEGDFDDFIYQMRLSIELGEITVDEFVA